MAVRAIRGATQVDADDRDQVLEATSELLQEVLTRNELAPADSPAAAPTRPWPSLPAASARDAPLMESVLVVGAGLIGTSIGLALQGQRDVFLADHDEGRLREAVGRGAGTAWDHSREVGC